MRNLILFVFLEIVLGLFSCRKAPSSHRSNRSQVEFVNSNNDFSKYPKLATDNSDADVVSDDELELPLVKLSEGLKVLRRRGYTLLYDKELKIPRWVAWHLSANHTDGSYGRYNTYYEDEDVPLPRATNEDYKGSQWSRGHMCPAGDNKWDERAMHESNYLTNICPQHKNLNSGLWNLIERDCRNWAKRHGDLFITCGPIFLNGEVKTIGPNRVAVPDAFYKVVLRLKPHPEAIGFIVRNNEGKKKKDKYVNTVDDVERITGYDFFAALPDDLEKQVESHSNLENWK